VVVDTDWSILQAEDMWKQIAVSTKAMPLYVLMPTVSELMIERGWTRCYARVEEYGWAYHLLLAATYMVRPHSLS
jgi:lathosterol oxidase